MRSAAQAERRTKEAERLGYESLATTGTLTEVLASALGETVEEPGLPEDEPPDE